MPLIGVQNPGIERATVNEDYVLYGEATPGGLIDDGYHLSAIDVNLEDRPNMKLFGKGNAKFASVVQKGKGHSEGSYSGVMTYHDILYVMESALRRGVVSSIANNGVYTLSLVGATAGTHILTFGGVSTSGIAYSATAATIQSTLNGLSTAGVDAFSVVQIATKVFQITINAPYRHVGNLTGDGSGLTGATYALNSPNGTSLGVYRWTYTVPNSGTDDVKTYQFRRGLFDTALEAEMARYMMFGGINFKINPGEASINGSVYAQKMDVESTIVSASVADVPLVPMDMDSFTFYIGRQKNGSNGPEEMIRGMDLEFALADKNRPLFTVARSKPSFTTHLDSRLNTNFGLTVMKNAEGRAIRQLMAQSEPLYFVVESIGKDIIPGFPYRFNARFPIILTENPNTDNDGAASYRFSGQLAYDGGEVPVITVDTDIASIT